MRQRKIPKIEHAIFWWPDSGMDRREQLTKKTTLLELQPDQNFNTVKNY